MTLSDYLAETFVQNALIAATLVAITSGLIGPFVVMRDLAFAVHGTAELAFTGAAAGLLLGAPALLLRGRWRLAALVLADVLVSALLLADLMFFKWFDELVPYRMASEAAQVSGVGESTLSTFSPVQLLLFADLVVVAAWVVLLRGRALRPVRDAPSPSAPGG